MTFLRYPGGKRKLAPVIVKALELRYAPGMEYREPFVGGGSIAVAFARAQPFAPIWINDLDAGIAAMWQAALWCPERLLAHVNAFTPSVDAFFTFKALLAESRDHALCGLSDDEIAYLGFCKIAIHQISYSGLGTKSGGPLGGIEQKSAYPIDCRWSPVHIQRQIERVRLDFANRDVIISNLGYEKLIDKEGSALLYLDPPYYEKGQDLYQHSFVLAEHKRLAERLRTCRQTWVLSYDDAPEIRELYAWANVETVEVGYSITASKDRTSGERLARTKTELLISNP